MSDLHNYSLLIPALWEKNWSEAIEEAEGIDKELIIFQADAANILKGINDTSANFERLAWLSLWSKAFAVIDGVRASLTRNSEYMLVVLSRVAFEELIQIYTIVEPRLRLASFQPKSAKITIRESTRQDAKKETVNRLRAYAAWCLYNDKLFVEQVLHPKTLDDIWDPQPAKEIAEDPVLLRGYELLFGELDVKIGERELKKGRLRHQDKEQHRLHRIESWLEDPDIVSWTNKLRELYNQSGKHPVSFYSMFNATEASITKRLKGMGIRFAYISFMRGSMFIHGSTLDELLHLGNDTLTPFFVGTAKDAESKAGFVGCMCNMIIFYLYVLKEDLWADDLPSAHGDE